LTDSITNLLKRIRSMEDELEQELERRRHEFRYHIEQGRVIFEREVRQRHQALKQKLLSYVAGARPLVVLTAPVIYLVIVQAICFSVYRIEKVRRADYITFDRKHLSYLNRLEKLNCIYCSYGNGLLAYAVEIAGRTEKHWCPIKHAKRIAGLHRYYPEFLEYGDAEGYQRKQRSSDPEAGP
jgi:hypothetical protein